MSNMTISNEEVVQNAITTSVSIGSVKTEPNRGSTRQFRFGFFSVSVSSKTEPKTSGNNVISVRNKSCDQVIVK